MRVTRIGGTLVVLITLVVAHQPRAHAQDTKSRISVLLDNSGSMVLTPEIVEFPEASGAFNPCNTSGSPPPDTDCNGCVAYTAEIDPFCSGTAWDLTCRNSYRDNCYQVITGNAGCDYMDGVNFGGVATRGDGSLQQPGCDLNADGLANDSRIYQAKEAINTVAATFGEVEFALWRFEGVVGGQFCNVSSQCPTAPGGGAPLTCVSNTCVLDAAFIGQNQGQCSICTWTGAASNWDCDNCSGGVVYSCVANDLEDVRTGGLSPLDLTSTVSCLAPVISRYMPFSGPYDYGAGCDPLGGTRLVDFPATGFDDNYDEIVEQINHDGSDGFEIKASGGTPIAASLRDMRAGLLTTLAADDRTPCRSYDVIVLTDGGESCEAVADAVTAAANLQNLAFTNPVPQSITNFDVDVYVVGFAICPPADPNCQTAQDLDAIAAAGGTGSAILVDNQLDLQAALSQIVSGSIVSESCNGLDDDCDGDIDEDFAGLGNSCSAGLGACLDTGVIQCLGDGSGVFCTAVAGTPTPEVCNGIDDNCNGLIDDGIVCTSCIPVCLPTDNCDVCNNIDEDCDGSFDEDFASQPCGSDIGACTPGNTQCLGGVTSCDGTGQGPVAETCNNADDNCDTVVDGMSQACYTAPDGGCDLFLGTCDGICQFGLETCTAGMYGACAGEVNAIAEIPCNGLDDDCDGTTDEGSGDEQCNGLDDDCDGFIDEDVAMFDPDIGQQCGSGPPYFGECSPGSIICSGGVEVCDGEITPTQEICDGLDNDCNGTDDDNLIGFGGQCGTDVGLCDFGTLICQSGGPVCDMAVGPQPEVCDTFDNHCNGATDETDPQLGMSCADNGNVPNQTGICRFGVLICDVTGNLQCVGFVGPQAELCNGLDDNCDGQVDEDFTAQLGMTCDNGELGLCYNEGVYVCTADGTGTVCTAPPGSPTNEVCNGLDDDCNGFDDDGMMPLVGEECSPGIGLCDPGLWECNMGALECGAPATGSPEVCNGVDDNCNGFIDETPPPLAGEGEQCTDPGFEMIGDTGECEFGSTRCLTGGLVCDGYMGPTPEVCDGLDNDCDGIGDNMAVCPSATDVCFESNCVVPCDTSEFPCPTGFVCQVLPDTPPPMRYCVPNPCVGVTCPAGEFCDSDTGDCVNLCDGVSCNDGEECRNGFCLDCFDLPSKCMPGELCIADSIGVGQCENNPCDPNPCELNEVCNDGVCLGDCAEGCPVGELCVEGMCETDLCDGVQCSGSQFCDPNNGTCVNPNCEGIACNPGEICVEISGDCIPNPCLTATCPEGTVCIVDAAGRDVCDIPDEPPADRVTAAGGGGCSVTGSEDSGGSGYGVLMLMLWAVLRRRGDRR